MQSAVGVSFVLRPPQRREKHVARETCGWFVFWQKQNIHNSSPCVPLLSVSSTRLDNGSLHAGHHNQQRNPVVLMLLAEGSVVLVLALGWWGMATLGSYS